VSLSKGFPYSLPSVGPGADPGVQAVSPQVHDLSHQLGGRLPLLSARPAVTFPAAEHHRPLAGTYLYRPTEGKRLSRPGWLVTYRNNVPLPEVEPGHGHPSQY